MQEKTRYVNISVGIGGWQPIKAEDVDRLSYGDCKALTNYMYSLLDYVGIKSIYTIVRAGRNAPEIVSDFPRNQFNHAILCVPLEKDTVWLECTNQKIPAGYIGKFTDNRDVLIIEKDNSKLLRTKAYSKNENKLERNIQLELFSDRSAKANVITKYIGLKTDDVYGILNATDKDKKNYLYAKIDIPDFNLIDFKYSENEAIIPEITEEVNIEMNSYSSQVGERIIIPINLMNKVDNVPRRVKNRKNEVIILRSSIETDYIKIAIPKDYYVENIPDNSLIETAFGKYNTSIEVEDGIIHYKRTLSFNKGEYSKEIYNDLREFLIQVSRADNNKLVLSQVN